jgi:hypothetical protein
MDAERKIHEKLFGKETAPAEPVAEAGEETDLDDLDALFL